MRDIIKCPNCEARLIVSPEQDFRLAVPCPKSQHAWERRPGGRGVRLSGAIPLEEQIQVRPKEEARQVKSTCLHCAGKGVVLGMVDDLEFEFECPCSGGNEKAVRWLLGRFD
jgi:hypothetical protein